MAGATGVPVQLEGQARHARGTASHTTTACLYYRRQLLFSTFIVYELPTSLAPALNAQSSSLHLRPTRSKFERNVCTHNGLKRLAL